MSLTTCPDCGHEYLDDYFLRCPECNDQQPMPKEHILCKLYHEIGKQSTNFALQHSHKEGEETIWTKRKTFLEIDPATDQWFIEHCNHRQILKNEIIFDFDRPIDQENALQDADIRQLITDLEADQWRFCVYHSGSKGVHLHIYFDGLIVLSPQKRERFRQGLLKHYTQFVGVDLQKASDACMIALEHTPHWKTGRVKTLLYNRGVDAWS